MTVNSHQDVIHYYEHLLDHHKQGPLAVDWNTEEAQELLFFTLIDGLDEEHLKHNSKVLDVGCGLGALNQFFNDLNYSIHYTGYDLSPKMIKQATSLHPNGTFEVRDILIDPPANQTFDYAFLSGSISLILPDHEHYVRRIIAAMYDCTKIGIAFNLLSSTALQTSRIYQTDYLRYYPRPQDIFAFCQTITPFCNLRQDHNTWTFTIQMFHPGHHHSRTLKRFMKYQQRQEPLTSEPAIKLVNSLSEVKDFQTCLDICSNWQAEDAEKYNSFAVSYSHQKKYDQEKENIEKALHINPDHSWALQNMAARLFREKEYDQAILYFHKAIQASPENISAREQLFYMELNYGDPEKAAVIADSFKDEVQQLFYGAEIAFTKEHYQHALTMYQQAIQICPWLLDAHRRSAACYNALQDYQQAVLSHEKVLYYNPTDSVSLKYLARFYYKQNNVEALERILLATQPNEHLDLYLVKTLMNTHQLQRALHKATALIHSFPDFLAAHILQVEIFIKVGDSHKALLVLDTIKLKKGIEDYNDHIEALEKLLSDQK